MKSFTIIIALSLVICTPILQAQDTWTQVANFGGSARYGAVGFSIGSKGYIGTGYDTGYKNDFWQYDPATDSWTQKADFGGSARYFAVGFSIDSKGYIGTGDDGGYTKDFWEYDPAANTWTKKANFGGSSRYWSTGFSIGSKGYIGLGNNSSGYKNDFWEYDPATNSWLQKVNFGGTARGAASGFSIGDKGYIGTGYDGTYKKDFWEYNPSTNQWIAMANFGGVARYEAVGFYIGEKGYIGTGSNGTYRYDFWEYEPQNDTWTQKINFEGTARARAVGFSIGALGYIGTGFDNNNKKDFWMHTPEVCNGLTVYADADNDSYGDLTNSYFAANCVVPAGYVVNNDDCNDSDSAIHPGACDGSNGVDDDCDGNTDDGSGAIKYYADADHDGYGSGTGSLFCSNPGAGYSTINTDCVDNNSSIHPYTCDGINGVDDNCNGIIDDGSLTNTYYSDDDHDGYGTGTGILLCIGGTGYSYYNTDCADTDASINPGTAELVNGIDDNCDGIIDANYWTQKSDFAYNAPYPEPKPRIGAVGFSIGSKGYMGTGYGYDGINHYYKDFWEFDPATSAWSQKADFGGTGRSNAFCFAIAGKGYVGTGSFYDGTSHYLNDFWEYDPVANTWTQKTGFGGTARQGAFGFSVSNKGYAGTGSFYDGTFYYHKDFWEYDPFADTWTQKTNFAGTARFSAVGFSIDNKGYMGTGFDDTGTLKKDFWEYDPDTDIWTQKANFGGAGRYAAVGFGIGDMGYIGTGDAGYVAGDFWEFDPAMNTWTQKAYFSGTDRYQAVGFSIDNKGYIGTGWDYFGLCKDFWEYDTDDNSWTKKPDYGEQERFGAVGFSIGSKGYLGTGNNYGTGILYKDFWEYDPVSNSWTQKADFGGIARSGAVGFSIGNKGYLGTGANTNDFWEYDPALNMWIQKADFGGSSRYGAVGFSIGTMGYVGTGNSTKDFWQYDPVADVWTKKADYAGGNTHYGTGFSIASKGYIGTGYDPYVGLKRDFWEYDPNSDSWVKKADFGGNSRMSSVGFSIGNKGYIGTGTSFDTWYTTYISIHNYNDFWEYNPAADSWISRANFGGQVRQNAVGFSIGIKGYIGTGLYQQDYISAVFSDFWEYTPETSAATCSVPGTTPAANITSNSAKLKWLAINQALSYKVRYKVAGTSEWIITKAIDNTKTLHGLTPNTEYTWQVKSFCDIQPVVASEWSEKQFFTTDDLRVSDGTIDETIFELYPNPVSQFATISFSLNEASPVIIEILDVNGRSLKVIADENFSEGSHEIEFNSKLLSAGIYFLQMKTNNGVMMKKMVIE